MADNSSGYTSFVPLTPESKSITSGFSFARIFDFQWKKGKQTWQNISEENETEHETKEQGSKTEVDCKELEKSITQSLQSNATGNASSLHPVPAAYGQSKSENSSLIMPRKEKGRYRNVKTILRRLSAIAVDKRWHQVI